MCAGVLVTARATVSGLTLLFAVVSREALVTNESHLKQAERIMQLAELSRKMETEREKVRSGNSIGSRLTFVLLQVLPFYESTVQSLHAVRLLRCTSWC